MLKSNYSPPPDDGNNEARRFSEIYQFYYQPLLLMGFLITSFWTSNSGVLAMAEWISGASENTRQIVMLVTATAMGAQFVLWHYCMRLIPRYVTYQARGIGILVVILVMLMMALSSTWTSFIGTSQDSARGLEMLRQSDIYAAKASMLAPRASAMEDALFVVNPQAQAACARYDQELSGGVITGSRGKGVVTGYLLGFCTSKTEIANALSETISANTVRMDEIQAISLQLDLVIYDRSKTIGERELIFLTHARRMDGLLQELQNADRTKGLRASYAAMSASVTQLEGSQNSLAAAQTQAIASIIAEEKASGAAIEGLIANIETLPLPESGRATIKPAQILVLEHWRLHLPQLAMAMIIDLFAPLSTMLFWAASMRQRRKITPSNGETK